MSSLNNIGWVVGPILCSKELEQLKFPLSFLDFETFQDAIPQYAGTRPFEQTPFQYSLHILDAPDAQLEHKEFLANANQDPRRTFIDALIADLPSSGTVIVYNRSFEAGILRKLAGNFTELETSIENILARFFDLMAPFQRRDYYHPQMHGSYSIKKVLPALVPSLNYNDLAIAEGASASRAFLKLRWLEDLQEINQIRTNLLEYCKLDTLAMVEIWKILQEI